MTKFPVFDGHNDTVLHLTMEERGKGRSFFERSEIGHLDLPRAKEGGFAGGFFAMFIPNAPQEMDKIKTAFEADNLGSLPVPSPLTHDYAISSAMRLMRTLMNIEEQSKGEVKITRTVDEIETCIDEGTLAMILHFEGAEAIDTEFNALEVFFQAGLRSLGIVWSRPNAYGHGVPFRFPHSPDIGDGLTDAGRALVKACNELGILLDLSHLNEKGFWDIAKLSDSPLVATHSNVHALCQTPRNLTDKQLDAIKESDGMVGLNFAVSFLREDGGQGVEDKADMPIETMVRHIDYLVERIGIDRVGMGSDFDGTMVCKDIGDVTGLPNLFAALKKAGYDDESLEKIAYKNWMRLLRKTWK